MAPRSVINPFLKKEQMLKQMVAKSKKDLQQRHLVEVEGSDALVCPETLRAFADPIKIKMTDIQNQLAIVL